MGTDVHDKILLGAPMAEISTPALRSVIRTFSPRVLLYSEMLSAGAIMSRASYNSPLTHMTASDDPLVYQIVGNDPTVMATAAAILQEKNPYGIDLNMGCPVAEIRKKGYGSALLDDVPGTAKIVSACRRVVSKKLSVKMRSGTEIADEFKLLEFCMMLQNEGVESITLHPRTARQGYARNADWHFVDFLAKKLDIPVYGNGDITTVDQGIDRLKKTSCCGIMIGRQAIIEPWIFRLIESALEGKTPRLHIDRGQIATDVLQGIDAFLPQNLHKSRAHRFLFYYTKNFFYGHELFSAIRKLDSIRKMIRVVNDYLDRNPHERITIYGDATENVHEAHQVS